MCYTTKMSWRNNLWMKVYSLMLSPLPSTHAPKSSTCKARELYSLVFNAHVHSMQKGWFNFLKNHCMSLVFRKKLCSKETSFRQNSPIKVWGVNTVATDTHLSVCHHRHTFIGVSLQTHISWCNTTDTHLSVCHYRHTFIGVSLQTHIYRL